MISNAVFITCAVTGSGDSVRKSPHVPVTPEQIATSALDAHAAGAAIVHLHVRDPASGAPSRDRALYRESVELIRSRNDDVIINLTGGMGGDIFLGPDAAPLAFGAGTDFVGPAERVAHISELLPEIGSLDCGSLNFDEVPFTAPRRATCATWREESPQPPGSPRDRGVRARPHRARQATDGRRPHRCARAVPALSSASATAPRPPARR